MPNKPNHISITISTSAGDLTEDFPANQPLNAIKHEVMGRLKLDPSQADKFVLVRDGQPLDESQSLSQLDIPAGTLLVLERKEVVKI